MQGSPFIYEFCAFIASCENIQCVTNAQVYEMYKDDKLKDAEITLFKAF